MVPVDGEIVKKVGQSVSCRFQVIGLLKNYAFVCEHNECLGINGLRYKGGFSRKDKAVNRFTRLRVKRANHETMASENNSNKKIMFFLQYETSIANRTRIYLHIYALDYTLCLHSELFMSITSQRHGTVKGTMDVKELVLLLAKNLMNHQSLLLVKDCATPPALKKEVSAAGERDKEGREVGEKKTEGG
ncbi:hypothetical protein HID58_038080 [Brassica napus]|uniref:Uncharacterized protein n=1 Tax=Brassica napus TaxID=3708 RepID=A0ABQ8BN87_BRANA|nr:hypothetical protein HID58_038080 [Brassica napus]